MHLFEKGQLVKSKAGRDQDKIFIVVEVEGDYVYLADGQLRKVEAPKKKKQKHVQPINCIVKNLKQKLEHDERIRNEEIRNELADYLNNKSLCKEE